VSVHPLQKTMVCVAMLLAAAPLPGLAAQEDAPAEVKSYVGKWRSATPANDRVSFTIAWEEGKLRITNYIFETPRDSRMDLTDSVKIEKAFIGTGYTISGSRPSPGFQIRNMVPKDDTLLGEVLYGGRHFPMTYVKDE